MARTEHHRAACVLLGLATLFLAAQPQARADAMALSNVPFFTLKFSLTGDQSVSIGNASPYCVPPIGHGDCGPSDLHASWQGPTASGPTPDGDLLSIAGYGESEAYSPPSPLSWFIEGVGGFFSFTNNSSTDETINVTWNIAYQLITEGKASGASVGTTYSEKDVTSGLVLIEPTSWTGFVPASANNGQHVEGVQLGSFGVIVPADSTTDLHIEVVMNSLAINVPTPDPSSLLLSASGLTTLLGFARWRRKR